MTAFAGSTIEFQPEMVPSSVAKRNRAGSFGCSSKKGVLLNIVPVGVPVSPSFAAGMVTIRGLATGFGAPVPSYSVALPLPLSEIHQGVLVPRDKPQAFTR